MTLFEYLDIRFQNESLAQSTNYLVSRQGRINAIHWIIGTMRSVSKVWSIPALLIDFLFVKIGVEDPPQPPKRPEPKKEAPKLEVVSEAPKAS